MTVQNFINKQLSEMYCGKKIVVESLNSRNQVMKTISETITAVEIEDSYDGFEVIFKAGKACVSILYLGSDLPKIEEDNADKI